MEILFNNSLIVVLRLLHIIAGALWVGAGVAQSLLFIPAIASSESAGQAVMKKFAPRFHSFMAVMSNITIFAGILLYSRFIVATGMEWIWSTGSGITFTIGALAGIASFIIGAAFFAPTQKKFAALELEIQKSGQPDASQTTRMNNLQTSIIKVGQIDFVLMLFALGAMAIARYL